MKKGLKKLNLSNVLLGVTLISTLSFGVLYVDTYKKLDEKGELLVQNSEQLKTLEKENGVLMSKETVSLDEIDLPINSMKEMLNKNYLLYSINYNNDDYYFWVDKITKKSIDITKGTQYDLFVNYKILKDKKVDDSSYVKDLDKKIDSIIAEENELVKKSNNNKNLLINKDRINELYSILTNDVSVSQGTENITISKESKNTLGLNDAIKTFVKDVIYENRDVDLKVTDKGEDISIIVEDEVFLYNKDSKTLNIQKNILD